MKTKLAKVMPFYYRCNKRGLPEDGLCACLTNGNYTKRIEDLFELLNPTKEDYDVLGIEEKSTYFWAYGGLTVHDIDTKCRKFSGLRRNIVLFIAAMNNEL